MTRRPLFAPGLALGLVVVVASVACSSVPVVRYDDEDAATPGTSSGSTSGSTSGGTDAGDAGACSPPCAPPAQCCKNPGGKLGCFTNCQ